MEEIACIFCRDSSSDVAIRENGFEARKCATCGLIFVSPRPSAEETTDLYVNDAAYLPAESHLAASDSGATRAAARARLSILRRYAAPGSTLLEIGAGGGSFLAEARQLGYDVQAVELNPRQAEFIRSTLAIPCAASLGELHDLTGRSTHDLVYFRNVISHFFDPIAELDAINGAVAPGGVIAFETGNLGDVDRRYFRHFPVFQLPDHLFLFSEASLETLLELTGFELVAIRRWSILPQLRLVNRLRKLRGRSTGDGAAQQSRTEAKPSLLRQAAVHVVDQIVPYRLGAVAPKKRRPQTLLVIARKRADQPVPRQPLDAN